MSKLPCKCETLLPDTTDDISYKGYIISDSEFSDLMAFIDLVIESDISDKERTKRYVSEKIWDLLKFKEVFQCYECGRIMIEDNSHRQFYSFLPEDENSMKLLDFKAYDDMDAIRGRVEYLKHFES